MSEGSVSALPRSFLYVPGNRPDMFAKAEASAADALILDLEDAVPLADKPLARAAVARHLAGRTGGRASIWVRVNAETVLDDLAAVVGGPDQGSPRGIVLAKCELAVLDQVASWCAEHPRRSAGLEVIAMIESARALRQADAIAAHRLTTALACGEVDLLADLRLRGDASTSAVEHLRVELVIASAAAGIAAPVAPTSTDVRDLDGFASSSRRLRDLGFRSRTAIHPRQVPVLHEILTPTDEEIAAARDIVQRFEDAAAGVTVDAQGRLIDAAVVRGAQETLARLAVSG